MLEKFSASFKLLSEYNPHKFVELILTLTDEQTLLPCAHYFNIVLSGFINCNYQNKF